MAMNNLDGIIYRVSPYGENGKLLNVFTKKGKVTLHARGSQKLNSPYLVLSQYLTKISFEPQLNKDFYNLKNGKLIDEYSNIKKDFQLVKEISLALELISKTIIDKIYSEKVYNLLEEVLNSQNIVEATLSFAIKLLYILGVGPNLEADGEEVLGFNISSGNLVYAGQSDTLDLNIKETIILLKLAYSKIANLEKLEEQEIRVIKNFINYYYLDKLDLKLKSLQ